MINILVNIALVLYEGYGNMKHFIQQCRKRCRKRGQLPETFENEERELKHYDFFANYESKKSAEGLRKANNGTS